MNDNQQLLDVLTREGVLVAVNVRYWRARKKLDAQDVGLDPDDVTERLISLGHKRLLPREALAQFALIESRAHAVVDAATFPFLGGIGRFLPNRKLRETTVRLHELEAEFAKARRSFARRYETLRKSAVAEWREAASKLVRDPARVVAAIEAAFPSADGLDRYFGFQTSLFQIRGPESLEPELVAEGDRQALVEARREAAQRASSQIAEGVDAFVRDAVASLREQTAMLCEEMLASMREAKSGVHQKTLNRLVDFIDRFKQLNFAGDAELEAQLDRARRELLSRTAVEYRDSATARRRLDAGIRDLADEARRLAASDATRIVERFGQMGVRKFSSAA